MIMPGTGSSATAAASRATARSSCSIPQKKSGVVALWNSDTWQPGGLEFEVMDMIYHLPFRDWLELNKNAGAIDRRRGSNRADSGGPS